MRRLSLLLSSFALLSLLHAPAFGQPPKIDPQPLPKIVIVPKVPAPSYKHLDGQLLVFAVNGVGGSTQLSDNLIDVNADCRLGLRIHPVSWCRHNAKFQDLRDSEAQLNAAARIACAVAAIKKDAPNAHIILAGHSAGARVVLAAAEMSPPKSLDRIFLFHAAVSSCYDLTGALKASRYGIDNFYSSEDGVLDPERPHYSNADGQPGHAAGRQGFRCSACDRKELEAYRAVRQYRWNEDLCGSGGHYAWTLQHNLKKVVAPMFFTAPVVPPVVSPPRMAPAK